MPNDTWKTRSTRFTGQRAFRSRVERNATLRRREVGRRLREIREQQKKPVEVVAKALGYDRSVLSRIESGRRKLDLIEAENFGVYYGFDLQNLATWMTQTQSDTARVSELKLAREMVLKREEFLERETEAMEKKKRDRRKNASRRAALPGLSEQSH